MSHQPFRFVHATNLRLDQPLWGLGEVDHDIRRLAEDATLIALERIFDACVDHDVRFLLLTGNCFDRAGLSLRAQSALEDGFEQLATHGIEVFVIPGETDPPSLWNNGLRLPRNVTTFFGDHSDPVAVVRDGQVLATIAPLDDATREPHEHRDSFRIGLLPAGRHSDWQDRLRGQEGSRISDALLQQRPAIRHLHYLALGSGASRLTLKLPHGQAHDPGSPQPLEPGNASPHGCSLVDVDARGELHIQLLPAAIIGWEHLTVHFDARDNWDQLAQRMLAALRDCQPRPAEKVEIIRWDLEGSGRLVNDLQDPASQQELCELVEQELADRRTPRRVHQMTVRQTWQPILTTGTSESLYDEFVRYVQTDLEERLAQFRRGGHRARWPQEPWAQPLLEAAARMESGAILEHARSQGRVWLTGLPDQHSTTGDKMTG